MIQGLSRSDSPVALIRQALAQCPDAVPAPNTTELNFIEDAQVRQNIRLDISTASSALINGEWKAATVLAGSVVEALLLWALQREPADIREGAMAKTGKHFNKNIQKWHLPDYIDVAEQLGLLTENTLTECRLAKDFRNLIHPGLAERLSQPCDRGTALSAIAAVEHVVRDLKERATGTTQKSPASRERSAEMADR